MRSIKRRLLSNLRLKIISVIIAIIVWLAITTIGEDRESVYVPIVAQGLRKDTIVTKLEPEGVFVTVRGPIGELKSLNKSELKVKINLGEYGEGHHTYHIEKKNVILPKGLKLEDIRPDTVSFELDRVVKKRMKVIVRLSDDLEKKYSVLDYTPRFVEVEGAEKALGSKGEIETHPPKGRLEAKEEEIELLLNTNGMIIKNIFPSTVKVKLVRRGEER
ncbi:MAG: CdaR family protein [Desulfobacterota bacterium]|nr:CdaR family protein [Thermodesulfobacteriota bacterium]MDW8002263.1 CdaR family protein [Deltaproteobacteria bacterium]